MITLRKSTENDAEAIINIWRRAVDATHGFLKPSDRIAIEAEVVEHLPGLPMTIAVNDERSPIGFMLVQGNHMDALFVDPGFRGKGVGTVLVQSAINLRPDLTTDVNEQNLQAVTFYEKLGFSRVGRSEVDGQGREYPLIHLAISSPTKAPKSKASS